LQTLAIFKEIKIAIFEFDEISKTNFATTVTLATITEKIAIACYNIHEMPLFCLDKNHSQIFKKQQCHSLHKQMQLPPSYATHQRDGIMLPQRATFKDAYKVPLLHLLPSKTKETVFHIFSRTIWTHNKSLLSDMGLILGASVALCL
jgi:hypothetical protein